jgi:glycosyltransferase involved in cell wall biosynthesis
MLKVLTFVNILVLRNLSNSRGGEIIGQSDVLVSVIVPARNSAKTMARCLMSVKEQTHKNIEILVIDAFSDDDTYKIASGLGAKVYLLEGERTKAKNFAILKSAGDFLLFIDSDMILEPHVIEGCVRLSLIDRKIGGIIIPERSIGPGFWVRVRDFERSLYAGSKIESARFFVKKYVELAGGFDEGVIAYEESTLPQRIENIGMIVGARISSFILHIEEGFMLRKWLRKKRYYSMSSKLYSMKYEYYAKSQLSVFNRFHIFLGEKKWKTLLRHPVLSSGMFILKTLEFIASMRIN